MPPRIMGGRRDLADEGSRRGVALMSEVELVVDDEADCAGERADDDCEEGRGCGG